MGLLDFLPGLPQDPSKAEAVRMGLLNFGAAMMGSRSPNFGTSLGQGLLAGGQGYQETAKNSLEQEQKRMQLAWMKQLQGEMGGNAPSVSGVLSQGAANGSVGPTVKNAASLNQQQQPTGPSLRTLQTGALLGMKNMEPLFNMFKYQNDGVERKPGSLYRNPVTGAEEYIQDPSKGFTWDQSTQSVKPIAGFAGVQGGIEGAKARATEQAKADFDVLDPTKFVLPGGVPFAGTRSDFINQTRPVPSGSATGPQGLDTSKLTAQQIATLRQRDPQAFNNGVSNFNATGGVGLQSQAEKSAQIGAIEGKQGTVNELNKNWINTSYNPVQSAADNAKTVIAQLDTFANIDFKTGWGAEARAGAANILSGLGIASQNAEAFAGDMQKFQSVAMDRLWTTLNTAKGPQTEGDAGRAKQTFLQLQNTPAANQYISDLYRAKANVDLLKAQYYQEMLPVATQEGDLNRIDREWKKIQPSIWSDPVLQRYVKAKKK